MFAFFLFLLSPLPAKPTTTFSHPLSCERVAWLNLGTGKTGHTYCLAEPKLHEILGITNKVPGSVYWVEKVDCSKASGTHVCQTSDGVPVIK